MKTGSESRKLNLFLFFLVLLNRIAWPRRLLFCFITIAKGLLFRKYIAIHFFFRQLAVYLLDS